MGPALLLATIHPSAWRNCLVNSWTGLDRVFLVSQSSDKGASQPVFSIHAFFRSMEPQSGAHSDFPNSFGSSVLGSSRAGSSVNWESYSAIDAAVSTTFLEPDRAETYLAKPGLLYEDLLKLRIFSSNYGTTVVLQ